MGLRIAFSRMKERFEKVQRGRYWAPFSLAVLPTNLLYSAISEGEQIISRTSKLGGCNLIGNRSRATQGLVYIFGSSIVTVSSK